MPRLGLILGLGLLWGPAAFACAADADRGAVVPWTTCEAEQAKTNASLVGPDFAGQTAAREASGRRYVRLAKTGDYVEFTAPADAQGLVVRYSLPDEGDATVTLSVANRPSQKLALSSKLSHLYGSYPFGNDPAAGSPRAFWDEARLIPAIAIHAGDVVRLEKSADDRASEYGIDFLEFEQVPPAKTQPPDALSIIDFGATPDDATDDRQSILAAIAAAKTQHKSVWLPSGRFVVAGPIELSGVTVQGAGMWHTTLVGSDDYRVDLEGTGSNVTLADFAILGKLDYRNDSEPNDGIGGSFGAGSAIRNLWVEHTKTGAWLTNSDGLVVEGCRFRNTIADGINLCLGMRNTIVRDCSARGTGDDCFAMWPATYAAAGFTHGGNRFVRCTAQLPYLAQGFSIYGGDSNGVEDCLASDVPYGAGLFASTTFVTQAGFRGTTTFARDRVVRAGDREGAVGTVANRLDLVGLRFQDVDVIDSPHDAVRFMSVGGRALRDATLDELCIGRTGLAGDGHAIAAADDAVGAASIRHVTIEAGGAGTVRNVSQTFELTLGVGTESLHRGR